MLLSVCHYIYEVNYTVFSRFGIERLKVKKYTGNADARNSLRKEMKDLSSWNVLLTTYQACSFLPFIFVNDELNLFVCYSLIF